MHVPPTQSRSVLRRRFVLRRMIPRLVVVLSLLVFGYTTHGQNAGALPDGRATAPIAQPESLPDLVRRVKPSVVSVLTYDAKGEPLISGSGFFVRPGQVV